MSSESDMSIAEKIASVENKIQHHRSNHGRFAAGTWRFLEDRSSSVAAYAWSLVIPSLVVISLVVSFWQTVDSCPLSPTAGAILHVLCELVFAVELLLRFIVSPDRRIFVRSPLNAIDLLTVEVLPKFLVVPRWCLKWSS